MGSACNIPFCLPPTRIFFSLAEQIVIEPTPPGTGVINAHLGATSSNFTSPFKTKATLAVFFLSTRVVPTSITTAPCFTISAVTKLGCPIAAMIISAIRHSFLSLNDCGDRLLSHHHIVSASSAAPGFPTMLPRITHFLPLVSML